ncbi:MAG: haloacetate dehalogenase [Pseudonocardiales bacterium]|nr:haloacetate dehalogenase [Pseudonocardiales bacterium]
MATAVVNGIHMHYRHIGAGSPIVLLHGWPQTGYAWRHVADDLATDLSALVREPGFHPDDRHPWSFPRPDVADRERSR